MLLAGCATTETTSSKPPTTASKSEKKTCPPGSDASPGDAKARMGSLQADVRKCFTLATGGAESEVKVEITIGASGEVVQATVLGGAGDPSGRACFEKTMRAVKFGRFCGPDVSIRWTYALR